MGSFIEVNDTLQITPQQGFPSTIFDLQTHQQKPVTLEDVKGLVFNFNGKVGARLFHLDPVRVFLVQNIDGKWLFWGKVFIQSQAIGKLLNPDGTWIPDKWVTSGSYLISEIYEPSYQKLFTSRESPPGKSYFD